MTLLKCKECGKEISSNAEKCVHCGFKLKTKKEVDGIEKNIKFFLTLSKIIKRVFIPLAVILILVAFLCFRRHEDVILLSVFIGIGLIFMGLLLPPFLKWKVYVLQILNDMKNND